MQRAIGFAIGAALAFAAMTSGAPAAAASTAHVSVTLKEMAIVLGSAVPAGPVVFDITNAGTVIHELVVLRTDMYDGTLPARASDASKAEEVGDIAEVEDIDPGKTAALSLTLAPGRYMLICNEPGHHAAGMHATFVVASPAAISLKEMSIQAGPTVAVSGPVTFSIANIGTVVHELVVLKTDTAEGSIPARVTDPSKAQEPGAAGEAEDIDPGKTATLTLDLAPGKYVLICNEPGHYAAGMHTSFTILATESQSTAAANDLALFRRGIDVAKQSARVNIDALLKAPGVVVSDADRAAITAGYVPRSVTSDGSFLY